MVVVRSKRSRNFAGTDVAKIVAQFIYGLPSIVLATKLKRNATAKSYELEGTSKAVEAYDGCNRDFVIDCGKC